MGSLTHRRRTLIGALLVCGGCTSDQAGDERATIALDDAVVWLRSIEVEENRDVMQVDPSVSIDPEGGFLVADRSEGQIRRHSGDGRLEWFTGRKGQGPGEYGGLRKAVRLQNGEVLAADRSGRFTFYTPDGGEVIRTVQSPLHNIEELRVTSGAQVLVSGILEGEANSPRLHLWDVAGDSLASSFFRPFERVQYPEAAVMVGWSRGAIRGDTVAAIFALIDTVFFFTTRGEALGQSAIPFASFRRVPPMISPERFRDPLKRAQWFSSFDIVHTVYWLPDGDLLVNYQNAVPDGALSRQWHFLVMSPQGSRAIEVRDTPYLLVADEQTGDLHFVQPGTEVPNRWVTARLSH